MVENLNKFIRLVYKYATHHWLYSLVGGYFMLSILVLAFFEVSIGIPCLIRYFSGYECPGCGLTHAFSHLLKLEFPEAWRENKLSFIILPAGGYYILNDFLKFRKSISYTTV